MKMEDEQFKKHNRVDGGFLTLDILDSDGLNRSTYEIELSLITTHQDLCHWTRQLGEKTWMDKDRLIRILELMSQACNLPF